MPKRVLSGTIVSDKGEKTVVVRVDRRVKHPLYGKIIRRSKKYHAHDEANAFKSGEQVRIEECAPISKLKTWTVIERIGAAKAEVIAISEPENARPEAKGDKFDKIEKDAKADKAAKADTHAKEAKADKEAKAEKGAKADKADASDKTKKPAKAKKAKDDDTSADAEA